MKILFCVQGEGRGHMTQAIATLEILKTAGHQIVGVVVGLGRARALPAFFESAMGMPLTVLPAPEFVFKNNRAVHLSATIFRVVQQLPAYWGALRRLKTLVQELKPDLILNFFEPLTGIYALTTRRRPAVVAIGHQFMFGHPRYTRAPGMRLEQWSMKWFIRFVGSRSTRLALSLYEAQDLPERSLIVCPPILRQRLFELSAVSSGDFILIYLVNHGYAEQINEWHRLHKEIPLHCFYDKPGAPSENRIDATLTFHRLDGEKFLLMMAQSKAVVCTAGFESVSEAAYLDKALLMVPVENHIEQHINALDAVNCGFGITDRRFNLDRLQELPARLDNQKFRDWLRKGEAKLLRALEMAVRDLPSAETAENTAPPPASRT